MLIQHVVSLTLTNLLFKHGWTWDYKDNSCWAKCSQSLKRKQGGEDWSILRQLSYSTTTFRKSLSHFFSPASYMLLSWIMKMHSYLICLSSLLLHSQTSAKYYTTRPENTEGGSKMIIAINQDTSHTLQPWNIHNNVFQNPSPTAQGPIYNCQCLHR